jgi:hypothetical protein
MTDNSKIDKADKIYKFRLFCPTLGKEFFKFGSFHSELFLAEMMVCYYGKYSVKIVYAGEANQV